MKTPLRYQVTEYDCGTISLLNAISYLYERREIPARLLRAIHLYTLDCYDEKGNESYEGNAYEAIKYLCKWIASYSSKNEFDLNVIYLEKYEVTYENILKCIRNKGVVFIKLYNNHYVIITNINELNTYIFDPYYEVDDDYDKDEEIRVIESKPCDYNRIVRTNRMMSSLNKKYCLGKIEERECVLLYRK